MKSGTAERYTYMMQHDWVPALGTQAVLAITRESIKNVGAANVGAAKHLFRAPP